MKQKFFSEKVVSVSAIIIAVASIVVTIWEGMEIRHHNRLSVRPKFEIFYYPDTENNNHSWFIVNNGIGPGFLKSSKAIVDDKVFSINYFSSFSEIAESLNIKDVYVAGKSSFNPGLTIISGAQKKILTLAFKNGENPGIDFWHIHERIKFKIGYTSMYNELFECEYPMDSN
ncbi:hypothetical protein JW935_19415 [candidate division KSB1 bacterium]|nr:hypothetical protein [candidate division KSB1 bacterium]